MTMTNNQLSKQDTAGSQEVERTRARRASVPKVDIYETPDAVVLLADLPGVLEKDLHITLENDVLTLEGTAQPRNRPGYSPVHQEYNLGDYRRVFTLATEVDRDKIEATLNAGVLRLVLPKSEPMRARRIPVKT